MDRDFITYAVGLPTLIIGAIWAIPRILGEIYRRTEPEGWTPEPIEGPNPDWWKTWEWDIWSQVPPPENNGFYASHPAFGSSWFPSGSEDWLNQNYPGWTYA